MPQKDSSSILASRGLDKSQGHYKVKAFGMSGRGCLASFSVGFMSVLCLIRWERARNRIDWVPIDRLAGLLVELTLPGGQDVPMVIEPEKVGKACVFHPLNPHPVT